MKTNYLFPEKCKTIGWILILFGLVTAILSNEDMLPNLGPTKAISLIPSEKEIRLKRSSEARSPPSGL